MMCVLCGCQEKNSAHLFVKCRKANEIWMQFGWWDIIAVCPGGLERLCMNFALWCSDPKLQYS
ncbi:hypothetical protein SLEP1_g6748 [Rubroshorea leprosula]|uniref:Reverse transcriptase zinc-binding domain-containing protein n=1 Tax=Rubroshorea leprosula TaxID=152421 RepID=A0AAV5I4G8_9ROSI|nr:hypothetical protein SLEP1_g6748 [Rubroshorea leprosula]